MVFNSKEDGFIGNDDRRDVRAGPTCLATSSSTKTATYPMQQFYSLCFIVDHEPTRNLGVSIRPDDDIETLQQAIRARLEQENVSVGRMNIWKLNMPMPLTLDTSDERRSFAKKIKNIQLDPDSDDPPGVVQLRYATRTAASYWEKNPPHRDSLHLIVQLEQSFERPQKRQRLIEGDNALMDMQMLWDQTWNRKEEDIPWFILRETERDGTSTTDVPEYSWVLSPPENIARGLGLNPQTVLFRDDYLRVFSDLFASSGLGHFNPNLNRVPGTRFPNFFSGVQVPQKCPKNAFVLTGHPGIGKSIWLRTVLILRLCARLPTFFATTATSVFLFSDEGPLEIPLNSPQLRCYLRKELTAWALFDLTPSLKELPYDFVVSGDIFVVQIPPPHSECMQWIKKAPPITICCLGLWSPAELICAAPLQKRRHNERALVEFCDLYGFSARDAYGYASDIAKYQIKLTAACDHLSYESIAKLVSQVQDLHFPGDISHAILCISPTQIGLHYTFDFISQYVYSCVLAALRKSQVHAASKLYRLFLGMGKIRSVAGYMLEPAAQEIISNGGTFEIFRLKGELSRTLIHWKTPDVLSDETTTRLHITSDSISVNDAVVRVARGKPPMLALPKSGPLKDFAFYFPRSQTRATYDFLLYDPKDNHAWVFQVTTSASHSVKAKDIKGLSKRGIEKISYIVIAPPDATIDLPFSKKSDESVIHKYQLRLR